MKKTLSFLCFLSIVWVLGFSLGGLSNGAQMGGGGGTPSGAAGGSLSGTYPNPAISSSVNINTTGVVTSSALFINSVSSIDASGNIKTSGGITAIGGYLKSQTIDSAIIAKGTPVRRVMVNTSGGTLEVGDLVILDVTDVVGQSVKTTTEVNSPLVFGVVTSGGINGANVTLAVGGYVASVKANGAVPIAIGSPLACSSEAKIAYKGTYGSGGVFGVALTATTAVDSSNVINAWIN